MKPYIAVALLAASVAPLTLEARADRVRIDSHRKDRDIAIDGDSGDWTGPLVPLDERQPVSVAVANDGQFLYLVLTASDATTRMQIMREGLIVWFDPGGKDKKHFGIKFPVGMPIAMDRAGGDRRRGGQARPGEEGRGRAFEEAVNRLEILGPKKDDARSLVADAVPGVAVKVGQAEGSLVYELKVPLSKTTELPYAIDAKPGATIGLGLETPKMDRSSSNGERGRGMGGAGGMGGMGGGRRGGDMGRGGGMGGGRGGFERPKPMKIWATVRLAS